MASISNILTAAVGALVLSTAFVTAAVGPATTAGTAPAASYAVASVTTSSQATLA
ncbi:MAG: hypothetical protein ACXWUP_12390 [Allosphingosinicella sp.]